MPNNIDIPPALLTRGPGSLLLDASGFGIRAFVRESPEFLSRYDRGLPTEVKLPSWDTPPVVAIAFMLRIGTRRELTYQTWIDAGTPIGLRVLRQLGEEKSLLVHVVTDRIARTYRSANVVRDKAAYLTEALGNIALQWDSGALRQTEMQLTTLYPTSCRLWGACLRAERVTRHERVIGSLVS